MGETEIISGVVKLLKEAGLPKGQPSLGFGPLFESGDGPPPVVE